MADTEGIFIADRITKRRFRNSKAQYYVKWKNCPSSYNTWEPESNILDPGLILEFEARLAEACLKGKRPGRKPKLLKLKVFDIKGRTYENNNPANTRWKDMRDPIKDIPNSDHDQHDRVVTSHHCNSEGRDLNNNLQSEQQREDKWRIQRKPKSLFLEQSIKDKSSHCSLDLSHSTEPPSRLGAYVKADSPLVGVVPSPSYAEDSTQDCARCSHHVPSDFAFRDLCKSGNLPTESEIEHISQTSKNGNNVKLGKFALLRKYRSSLEESDPVTATDVTVEGVTVTVRESDGPRGFFGPTEPKPWVES